MTLKNLPPEQRPREKLLARGAAALADGELLALLLRTGYKGCGVFELSTRVLDDCGGNQTRAAEVLGIDRVTLHHKLKKYGWSRKEKELAGIEN